MRPAIAARAPNHLGDGVLALPAIHALAELGRLVIHGPGWARDVYRDVPGATVAPRGAIGPVDAAVLFPPSLRAAIEARWARRRIGTPTDHRRPLLTDVVAERHHRWDTYAALAAALGARADGPPRWQARPGDPAPPDDVPDAHIGLNPVTAGGDAREWPLFRALAARIGPGRALDRPVVVYGGPGEGSRVAAVAEGHQRCVGASLPAFARALARCALFVSNDSGAAHFARACGVPVLVIYGSTRPDRTGPLGAHAIVGPDEPCAPCYRQRCPRGLECYDLGVDAVLHRIRGLVDG